MISTVLPSSGRYRCLRWCLQARNRSHRFWRNDQRLLIWLRAIDRCLGSQRCPTARSPYKPLEVQRIHNRHTRLFRRRTCRDSLRRRHALRLQRSNAITHAQRPVLCSAILILNAVQAKDAFFLRWMLLSCFFFSTTGSSAT